MAIAPVSGINAYKGFNNNINFEGNKNNNKKQSSSIPASVKAVPVALLIAMSPMASSNANAANRLENNKNTIELVDESNQRRQNNSKLVEQRIVDIPNTPGSDKFTSYRFRFYSNTDDKSKIDRLDLGYISPVPFTIKKYVDLTLELYGDDGISPGIIESPVLEAEHVNNYIAAISHPGLRAFVQDFINDKVEGVKNNNAIEVKPLTKKIRLGSECDLQNVPTKPDWIEDGKNREEFFGLSPMSIEVQTKTGNYKVTAYNRDDNNDYEVVTIQREDGPEFKVAGIKLAKVLLKDTFEEDITNFEVGVVELYKRNSKEKVRIINTELYNKLIQITNDPGFNNAYENSGIVSSTNMVNSYGIVSPIN